MQQIGWSLVDASGTELSFWGDVANQCAAVPDDISLPNGDRVHGASPGPVGDCILVPRMLEIGAVMAPAFDGHQVVVTRPAPVAAESAASGGVLSPRIIARLKDEATEVAERLLPANDPQSIFVPTADHYPLLAAMIGISVPNTGNARTDYAAAADHFFSEQLAWAKSEAAALAAFLKG